MKIDLSQFRSAFIQESAEHLSSMESGLLDLRSSPDNLEILNAIFRSAHSIKGGAGTFGLHTLVRFTHALESLLDRLRALEIDASQEVIGLLLRSVDVLRGLLDAEGDCALPPGAPELMARVEEITTGGTSSANAAAGTVPHEEATAEPEHQTTDQRAYRVNFRPARDMFLSGTNPIFLLRELGTLGTVSVCELHCDELPSLADLDPAQCYLSWTIELATNHPEEELREVFEFVEHLAELTIECLDAGPIIAVDRGEIQSKPAARAGGTELAIVPAVAPILELALVQESSAVEQRSGKERRAAKKPAAGAESSSIRVSTDKVDRLIDLVGELVIAHVMTSQIVEQFTPDCLPKLRDAVAAIERNTRELHERVMGIRMLPVGALFQRYARTVYDIAQATGKEIRLETSGEETEIDKSMLEMLGDPLTHIIRNSADHGVEAPEVRLLAGKPKEGTISLRAFHRSGRVVIEVTDDGAGIDPARVRAKAIERGLITADTQLTDDQLRMLVFEPGFSTRDQVTDLSGRGVGMDVVKRNIQQLNGTVALASELGRGSTVIIELPLTLAILEGLLVRVADRTLVLPLLSVIETVAPTEESLVRVAEQGEVVIIRGEPVPLMRLRKFLGIAGQSATADISKDQVEGARSEESRLVVVVEAGRRKIGLAVDELLGQQQVVVKSLERHFQKVEGLMGATILGDGCVAPIVDVMGLADLDLFSLGISSTLQGHTVHGALTGASNLRGSERAAL